MLFSDEDDFDEEDFEVISCFIGIILIVNGVNRGKGDKVFIFIKNYLKIV